VSAFEIVHHESVVGKLTCFDRLLFKGHLSRLYHDGGMQSFLYSQGVLLKHYGAYVPKMTAALKTHVQRLAEDAGRPYQYLAATYTKAKGHSKEELAREIAERDGITEGLVCVLAAVEPCSSFDLNKNRQTCRLEIIRRRRKCLHFYLYLIDRELGFCHVRIQSWFPFEIQIWANGHEILARAFERKHLCYLRHDNAFLAVEDHAVAATLAEGIATWRWPQILDRLATMVNPHLQVFEAAGVGGYYWVADQVEVSTDTVFRTRPALEAVLPSLFAHATTAFSAEDVLRFLGRRLDPRLACEIGTDARCRPEGWRIKHRMGANSIKVYDKASVLRVETTINDPSRFRVPERKDGQLVWKPMRKGVANLRHYFCVGQGANGRYLDALASAGDNREGVGALDRLCRPRTNRGRRHPRLQPVSAPDLGLFRAVMAGEHTVVGFRNADLQRRLYRRDPRDDAEARTRCQRTSRQIAKLRGHGLLAKVPRQRLYRVTAYGQRVMAAAIAVHDRTFPAAYAAAA